MCAHAIRPVKYATNFFRPGCAISMSTLRYMETNGTPRVDVPTLIQYSPSVAEPAPEEVQRLTDFVQGANGKLLVITGAGLSTESGIPDYRSPEGSYSKGHKPMKHMDFVRSPHNRARYWARSLKGYRYFASREPNYSHHVLAQWQQHGLVSGLVTQNVDRLHRRGGHRGEVEIHGNAQEVKCLSCGTLMERVAWTGQLEVANSDWMRQHMTPHDHGKSHQDIRADGDAHLSNADFTDFLVPPCPNDSCEDGVMMPTVVFFGGSLLPEVREAADSAAKNSSRILILGSTCQMLSVFRLIRGADQEGKPVAIVNCGDTRADEIASFKIQARISSCLRGVSEALSIPR